MAGHVRTGYIENMRILKLIALPLTATALLSGQYSEDDRQSLLAQLDGTRRLVAISLEPVSHKQSMWTPDGNRWNVLQITEHLALAETFLFDMLQKAIANSQPIPDTEKLPDPSEKDRLVLTMMTDRTQKAKAPDEAVPKDRFRNRDEAMEAFSKNRQKTMDFVRTTKLDLRRYKIDTPMGQLDAHQWILMISAHTERHVKQMAEVMTHPEYPQGGE